MPIHPCRRLWSQLQAIACAIVIPFPGICQQAQVGTYRTEIRTDVDGGRYEAVTNDPTGTRCYTLENGLTVYLARCADEPRVRAMVATRAGGALDPEDNTGLAHYLEHLLFNGTDSIGTLDPVREKPLLDAIELSYEAHRAEHDPVRKRAWLQRIDSLTVAAAAYAVPDEYRKLLSGLGGVMINAFTDYDMTGYWSLLPNTALEPFLRLELERFRAPALRAFEHELEIVYEEFNQQQDNAAWRKRNAAFRLLFPGHPYGTHRLIGSAEHLKNPSIPAIRSYYERHYVPGNMVLVLVGDIDLNEAMRSVRRTFGILPARPVPARPSWPKRPLSTVRDTTIHGPGEESVMITFRFDGAGSDDVMYTTLVDMMLTNNTAGLVDIALNGAQRVGSATTTTWEMNAHTVHMMDGRPLSGQSLEEVRELMLGQLDRIARGDFEPWLMKGAVNDLRIQQARDFSSSVNLSSKHMHTFDEGRSWAERLAFLDEMDAITKEQLMDFVNRRYTERVIVYHREGPSTDMVHAEKPPMTVIPPGVDTLSAFGRRLASIPLRTPEPLFLDFDRMIARTTTQQDATIYSVENQAKELFGLDIVVDMGSSASRELELAIGYLPLLGTKTMSVEQVKRRFYELGLSFGSVCGRDRTLLSLEGLDHNAAEGIALLGELIREAVVDTAAYRSYVAKRIRERGTKATDRHAVIDPGLLELALYGEGSPAGQRMSEAELRRIDPAMLVDHLHHLLDHPYRILYSGSDPAAVRAAFDRFPRPASMRPLEPNAPLPMREGKSGVFLVDMDGVQAEVIIAVPGPLFSATRSGPSSFFSPYMDRMLFTRLRQSAGLAYSTSAAHIMGRDSTCHDFTLLQFSAQADKLGEAIEMAMDMLRELPGTQADVAFVRADQLKRYGAERYTGGNILWQAERSRRMGIRGDRRVGEVAYVQNVDLPKLRAFFQENIADRPVYVLVAGSKAHIDLAVLERYGKVVEVKPEELFK